MDGGAQEVECWQRNESTQRGLWVLLLTLVSCCEEWAHFPAQHMAEVRQKDRRELSEFINLRKSWRKRERERISGGEEEKR